MSFSTVPIRSNGKEVFASWWNDLRTAGVQLESSILSPERNYILNSRFQFWQQGIIRNIARTAGIVNEYGSDQVLVRNSLTAPATVQTQRVNGETSLYAYKMAVTAKTDNSGNYDSFFIIGNPETQLLYNKTIVVKLKAKAFGNVDRFEIQFGYGTTEVFNSANTLGSPQNFVINSSTYTSCELSVSVGTIPTLSGMLWIRIRPNRATSGHETDVGNGIIIEEPMLCVGSVGPSTFFPAYQEYAVELRALERYYEKTFNLDTAEATATNIGAVQTVRGNGTAVIATQFRTRKRLAPTITTYPIISSTPGQILHAVSGTANAATPTEVSETNFKLITSLGAGDTGFFQFIADARIF